MNGYRGITDELWKMERRVECDVWYIENWTLLLDIKMEVLRRKSPIFVLRGSSAVACAESLVLFTFIVRNLRHLKVRPR